MKNLYLVLAFVCFVSEAFGQSQSKFWFGVDGSGVKSKSFGV